MNFTNERDYTVSDATSQFSVCVSNRTQWTKTNLEDSGEYTGGEETQQKKT